ncbi:two-component sensor histidine kinase [bacterium]|nr:two-component sensor histidine kinase [bacterium]
MTTEQSTVKKMAASAADSKDVRPANFFMQMILPRRFLQRADRIKDLRRYRRLWWYTLLLTLFVAYLPLFVMTGVNYYMYGNNVTAEYRYDISRSLFNVSRSLEFVIEERLSVLELITHEKSDAELLDHTDLAVTLSHLKETFGGFVDLGVIDHEGRQLTYVGPYQLEGVDYTDQISYQQAVVRGACVTEVFMGHRNVPHFAITVKKDTPGGQFYVLRATIDMEMLNRMIYTQTMKHSDDIFIISHSGILQTPSRSHGNLLEPANIHVPPYSQNGEVVENIDESGTVLGYSYIEDTPFILMITKEQGDVFDMWLGDQTELIVFLVLSGFLILIVVLWSSTQMVRQIRQGDQRRVSMLMNVEYTNKMATIGRLAASVAHEINNPLAIINEKAGLLLDMANYVEDFPEREKTVAALQSIIRSVERGGDVTHRLLAFTRKMESRFEPLDLRDVLSEVISFLEKEARHRNIQIYRDFAEHVPPIESDRGQLQQIFLNIVNNAFAAVPDSGKVRLVVEPQNHHVRVQIEDNGTGISPENLEHIFEPFFSTRGDFGTGLGLSITYGLVNKLGGTINVDSELGKGTKFIIVLPTTRPK